MNDPPKMVHRSTKDYNSIMAASALARLGKMGYNADVERLFNDAGIVMEVL